MDILQVSDELHLSLFGCETLAAFSKLHKMPLACILRFFVLYYVYCNWSDGYSLSSITHPQFSDYGHRKTVQPPKKLCKKVIFQWGSKSSLVSNYFHTVCVKSNFPLGAQAVFVF